MLAIVAAASLVTGSHVRSEDPVIAAVLRDGIRNSAVIRQLVEVIDASDVIVYLARGNCPRSAACSMMSGGAPAVRYVRINFRVPAGLGQRGSWHKDDLSVLIAHELQHAAEIAAWPDVIDAATMEAAYARHGFAHGGVHLDTRAAIDAGLARRAELRRRRR